MYEIDLTNHHMTKSSNEMQQICSSLHQLNIQTFTYIKIYNDDSREILTTNASWLNYFYKNALFNEAEIIEIDRCISDDYFIWSELNSNNISYNIGKELFNLQSGVTFVIKNAHYRILYIFASNKTGHNMSSYYHLYLDIFKEFIQHFTNRAEHLIKEATRHKIFLLSKREISQQPKSIINNYITQEIKDNFRKQLSIDKYYLFDDGVYLTKQEVRCAKLYVSGYSIKEIAEKIGISKRTVENYIQNVKIKLNCHYDKHKLYKKISFVPEVF